MRKKAPMSELRGLKDELQNWVIRLIYKTAILVLSISQKACC